MELRLAVSHGDDEPVSEEEQDLAELDDVFGLDVAGRLEDEEERIAVDLELRPLMSVNRILDRELVEGELSPHCIELILVRLVQPDPDEGVATLRRLERLLEREIAVVPKSILVDGAVDDHVAIIGVPASAA